MISKFSANNKIYNDIYEQSEPDLRVGLPHDVPNFKFNENVKTVKSLLNRNDIPVETVDLICQYISQSHNTRNTRFKGIREEFTICNNVTNNADIRIYGAGVTAFANLTAGSSSGQFEATTLKAYSASKLIATKITLYASDSGEGNDLLTTCNLYKISGDAYSKAHLTLLSDIKNSEARITLDTDSQASYVIRGNWSQPLQNIGDYYSVVNPQLLVSNTQIVNLTSKYVGNLGTYIITNLGTTPINVTPHIWSRFGTSSTASPIAIAVGASALYTTSNSEPYRFVSDVGTFCVTCNGELETCSEDLYVKITSNNNFVTAVIEKVYEVEISDDLTLDIQSDDDLKFFIGEGYDKKEYCWHNNTGQAFLGKILTTLISVAGPPILDRLKQTWGSFKYDSKDNVLNNIRHFLSQFVDHDKHSDKKQITSGKAMSGVGHAGLSDLFISHRKARENNKLGGKVDLYTPNHGFPVMESLGMSPLLANIKSKVQPEFKHIIEISFPSGFQYFPIIVDGDVITVALVKSHQFVPGISYNEGEVMNNAGKKIFFDSRLIIEQFTLADIIEFIHLSYGSYKRYLFDVYITLDIPPNVEKVVDRSWMCAWINLMFDAPDGLFQTGGFKYEDTKFKPLPIAPDVYRLKSKRVKKLILMADEESIHALGQRAFEELSIFGLTNSFMNGSLTGFWNTSITSYKSLGISREILKDNRVLVNHSKDGKVAKNFRTQFAAILSQNDKLENSFFVEVLSGKWHLLKERLYLPMNAMIGIRQRQLNTLSEPGNIEGDAQKGKFTSDIVIKTLENWLVFGYAPESLVTFHPVSQQPDPSLIPDVISVDDMSYELFISATPISILNTYCEAKGVNMSSISSLKKFMKTPHPTLAALQKAAHVLSVNGVNSPGIVATQLHLYILNVRDKLFKTNPPLASKYYKLYGKFTPYYDSATGTYGVGSTNPSLLKNEMDILVNTLDGYFSQIELSRQPVQNQSIPIKFRGNTNFKTNDNLKTTKEIKQTSQPKKVLEENKEDYNDEDPNDEDPSGYINL